MNKKKLLALLMALVMTLSLMPVTAFAEEGELASETVSEKEQDMPKAVVSQVDTSSLGFEEISSIPVLHVSDDQFGFLDNSIQPFMPEKVFVFQPEQTERDTNLPGDYYVDTFGNWQCDFRVSFNDSIAPDSVIVGGAYSNMIFAIVSGYELEANESLYLMQDGARGAFSSHTSYNAIVDTVRSFICTAVNLSRENIGKSISVSLVMWNQAAGQTKDDAVVVKNADGTPCTTVYRFEDASPLYLGGSPYYAVSGGISENGKVLTETDYVEQTVAGPHFALEGATTYVAQIGEGDKATLHETLEDAIAAAEDGDTVTLLADVSVSEIVEITKSITLDGDNHTLTTTASRGIWIDSPNVAVTIENMKIVSSNNGMERSIQVNPDCNSVTLNLNNITTTATYYTVNVCSDVDNLELNIDDCNLTGWSAVNLWGCNGTVNISNSTLIGINNKTRNTDGWNDFGTVVVEGDTTGQTGTHAYACDISIRKTTISASQTTGNQQFALLYNNPSVNNAITLTDCSISLDDNCSFLNDDGSDSTTRIKTTYMKDTTDLPELPEGYTYVDIADDYKQVALLHYVAQIGDTKYETLAEAFSAAHSGDTITLLANVENTGRLTIPAGVTLNGAKHEVTGNSAFDLGDGATVTGVNFKDITDGKTKTTYNQKGGTLTALYGKGSATVTNCTFENCSWDAIQFTPAAGKTVIITGNTFKTTDETVGTLRYVHIQSEKNVDFTVTVTGNKFYNCDKLNQTGLEVYYPKDADKVNLSGNYMDSPMAVCIGTGGTSYNNATAKALPFKDASLTNDVTVVASVLDNHVGDYLFTSLTDAIAAAQSGQTVKLLSNIDLTATVIIDKNLTINLNGHNIAATDARALHVMSGDVTITGQGTVSATATGSGSFKDSSSVIRVGDNTKDSPAAKLTIGSGVIVSSNHCYGVSAFGKNTGITLTVNGKVSVSGTQAAIATSGNGDQATPAITINSGAVVENTNTNGTMKSEKLGVYLPAGNLTVKNGARISGQTAIYQKSGTLTINGGTISGTGASASYEYYGNGGYATGDAIVIDSCNYPNGAPTAYIKNATITSANGKQVGYFEHRGASAETNPGNVYANAEYTLSTNVVKGWVANDGEYSKTIGTVSPVAQIGTTQYETVEAAIAAAAENGGTVKLLRNASMTGTTELTMEKSITLDLKGHTLAVERINLKKGGLNVITSKSGGTVTCSSQAFNVYGSETDTENYTTLTIGEGVKVNSNYAVCLFPVHDTVGLSYGATININGTLTGSNGTLFVSGNLGNNAASGAALAGSANIPVINIGETAEITSTGDQAIAMNGMAKVNVEDGARISGREAIGVKRGILNVNGGTLTATGDKADPAQANNNGTEETGAAISVTSTYNYAGNIQVNVSGGTITSNNNSALYVGHSKNSNNKLVAFKNGVTLSVTGGNFKGDGSAVYVAGAIEGEANMPAKFITGGTFSAKPAATYVAPGYEAVELTTTNKLESETAGWYKVGAIATTGVTQSTETKETFDATFSARKTVESTDDSGKVLATEKPLSVNIKASNSATAETSAASYDLEKVVEDAIGAANNTDETNLDVTIEVVRDTPAVVENKITYEVHPEATVTSGSTEIGKFIVTNDKLADNAVFTIKLPVPAAVAAEGGKVQVTHKRDGMANEVFQLTVETGGYVTISGITSFSQFELAPISAGDYQGVAFTYSLDLKDSININFYMDPKNALDTSIGNYTVQYLYKGGEWQTAQYDLQSSSFGYRYVVAKCAAKEMTEPVHVRVLYNGAIIKSADYTVKGYCDYTINVDDKASDALRELCRRVLDFGAAAQVRFNYNTDNPATATYYYDLEQDTISTAYTASAVKNGVSAISATVNLESRTGVVIYFTPTSVVTGYSVTRGGSVLSKDTDYTVIDLSNGNCMFVVNGISAHDLNQSVIIDFETEAGTSHIEYSPLVYAYNKQNNASVGNLCKALYRYWEATQSYFGN